MRTGDEEACRFIDTGGQHHDCCLVEDHLELQTQVANHVDHDFLIRFPGGNHHWADTCLA